MKLPFTIIKRYKTIKTKDEIYNLINSQETEKFLKGLRYDKFYTEMKKDDFKIYRESFGVDLFSENYPLISSQFLNENPTKLEVKLEPNYYSIGFFVLVTVVFIVSAIFINEIEIFGILKKPDIYERFLFSLGGILPAILCYIKFIRPIYKTEKWLVRKFDLKEIN